MDNIIIDNKKILDKFKRGYVEVDLDAIVSNMKKMKSNINETTKIIGVIKTDGYGHGCVPIGKILEPLDFMYGFAVATYEEAHILKVNNIQKPILILGYTFPYCYENLINEEIRPAVFDYEQAKELSNASVKIKKDIRVHIKVDTGMGRIGISPDEEGLKFVEYLMTLPGIVIEGIFTHFAKADASDKSHAYGQLDKFNKFVSMIKDVLGLDIPVKHCSNSAGILEMKEANLDVVRAGITMYGLSPSDEVTAKELDLVPALSLHSHIVYIKTLKKGQSVSYGGTFVADKDMRVATIPVGYGDGYPRSLSNKGYVLINGKRAGILGRICMDQLMVDVSEIDQVKVHDHVTLIGKDGDEHITADYLGILSGRFNYELVCDLSDRLPRVYIHNNRYYNGSDF